MPESWGIGRSLAWLFISYATRGFGELHTQARDQIAMLLHSTVMATARSAVLVALLACTQADNNNLTELNENQK